MPTLKVVYRASDKVVRVLDAVTATPGGFTAIGTFAHPDETYPDSVVVYHGVRDLLYKRSAANPANTASFPNNITDMHNVSIEFLATPRLEFVLNLTNTVIAISGNPVKFEVAMKGGDTPLTYQWYKNSIAISGATGSVYEISNVDINRQGSYYVIVTDDADTTVTSRVCKMTVATPVPLTAITSSATSLDLSVVADTAAGKNVTFAPTPDTANIGTMSIKTAPLGARATATLVNNVLNVKPVAAGAATSVVVTNGTFDITVDITVAA